MEPTYNLTRDDVRDLLACLRAARFTDRAQERERDEFVRVLTSHQRRHNLPQE